MATAMTTRGITIQPALGASANSTKATANATIPPTSTVFRSRRSDTIPIGSALTRRVRPRAAVMRPSSPSEAPRLVVYKENSGVCTPVTTSAMKINTHMSTTSRRRSRR